MMLTIAGRFGLSGIAGGRINTLHGIPSKHHNTKKRRGMNDAVMKDIWLVVVNNIWAYYALGLASISSQRFF